MFKVHISVIAAYVADVFLSNMSLPASEAVMTTAGEVGDLRNTNLTDSTALFGNQWTLLTKVDLRTDISTCSLPVVISRKNLSCSLLDAGRA